MLSLGLIRITRNSFALFITWLMVAGILFLQRSELLNNKDSQFEIDNYKKLAAILLKKRGQHVQETSIAKQKKSVNIFNLSKSLDPKEAYENIDCKEFSKFNIKVTFCNYDFKTDRYAQITPGFDGIREPMVFENFLQLLLKNPDLLVFDFGVFVGQYTLFAAKLKHRVVSVEAFSDNVLRIHKGAVINNLTSYITLFHNGLSDKPNEIKRLQSLPGHVARQNLVKFQNQVFTNENAKQEDQRYLVKTITMDDLVDFVPRNSNSSSRPRAVMKIDIEGFEARAFQKAQKLFDAVDFCVVFMEWQHQAEQTSIHTLIMEMIEFMYCHGFEPFGYGTDRKASVKLDRDSWAKWPIDVAWKKPGF